MDSEFGYYNKDQIAQMEVDHYNEMVRLRKELSDHKLENMRLLTHITHLEEGDYKLKDDVRRKICICWSCKFINKDKALCSFIGKCKYEKKEDWDND